MNKQQAMALYLNFLLQLQELARTGTTPANFGIHIDYVNEKNQTETIHLTVTTALRR